MTELTLVDLDDCFVIRRCVVDRHWSRRGFVSLAGLSVTNSSTTFFSPTTDKSKLNIWKTISNIIVDFLRCGMRDESVGSDRCAGRFG